MSLINQMLHDLDTRRGGAAPDQVDNLHNLAAANGAEDVRANRSGLWLGLFVVLAAAVTWSARDWYDTALDAWPHFSAKLTSVNGAAAPVVPAESVAPEPSTPAQTSVTDSAEHALADAQLVAEAEANFAADTSEAEAMASTQMTGEKTTRHRILSMP